MAFKITDSTLKAVTQEVHVGVVFCDVANTFDCVSQGSASFGPCTMHFHLMWFSVTRLQLRNSDL